MKGHRLSQSIKRPFNSGTERNRCSVGFAREINFFLKISSNSFMVPSHLKIYDDSIGPDEYAYNFDNYYSYDDFDNFSIRLLTFAILQ